MCAGGGGGGGAPPNAERTPGPGHDPNAVPDQEKFSDHWNSETESWNFENKPGYTRDDSRPDSPPRSGHWDKDTGYVYERKTGDFDQDKLSFYKDNIWTTPETGNQGSRTSGEVNV